MNETAAAAQEQGSGRRPWLIGIIMAAALIAIAALAIALAGSREQTAYEPGTVEATVAAYAEAWESGDIEGAYGILSSRAQARVPFDEFRDGQTWDEDTPTRVWIDERIDRGERVTLVLVVERSYEGLLGPDRYTDTIRLSLRRVDDDWRIDTPLVGLHPW